MPDWLTDSQTLKDRATQLLTKYKSGALVTQLAAQEFFQQRILNKDDQVSKNPGFCFAAMSYVEAERLRNNANLTGMKGRRVEGVNSVSFELKDPCSVFEKVKGTPKYFQKSKFDMISKFENIGPFQVGNG